MSFLFLLLGTVLYWTSLPPVQCWPLAFLVPVVWSLVVMRPEAPRYRWIYACNFVFWLASVWWVTYPHPLNIVGLLAMAGYLSIYWPLFFVTSRVAVHQLKIPPVLAMPICWIGCEYLRLHLLGGFSFCSLEHALYRQVKFIQIADIGGQYVVGGMIMLVGAGVGTMLANVLFQETSEPKTAANKEGGALPAGSMSAVFALMVLLAVSIYGINAIQRPLPAEKPLYIATLQGNIPVRLNGPPEQAELTLRQYLDLTKEAYLMAGRQDRSLDLIVWPETVCPIYLLNFRDGVNPSDFGWSDEQIDFWQEQLRQMAAFVREGGIPLLCGLSTLDFIEPPEPKRLNSALLIAPKMESNNQRYDKVHLVMFGEYLPFAEYLPNDFFLKTLCQEAGRGTGPVAMSLLGESPYVFAVNICFESTVPHFVRNQILTLKEQGHDPDILVNMSNDGWFYFSRQIDQHLATHVFRAVENRRAYITATNGGFSALIDARGRIVAIGSHGEAQAVLGEIVPVRETPLYHQIGDWPAFGCCILMVLAFIFRKGGSRIFSYDCKGYLFTGP